MEPIFIDLMQITGSELNINMTNLYVKGATTYKVGTIKWVFFYDYVFYLFIVCKYFFKQLFRADFGKLQFDITLQTPQLTYTSQYSLSQRFPALNVDVKGKGDLSGVLSEYFFNQFNTNFVLKSYFSL